MVQQVYRRVFNEMPIRLLAFDSNGKTIRLLERNAIAEDILFRIPRKIVETLNKEDKKYQENVLKLVRKHSDYAILSHTWIRGTPGDVVRADWERRKLNPHGNRKIEKFCEVAARDHSVSFGWMDTVCINKESSTELDESIRSMYRWYRYSSVCVTYLAETSAIEQMRHDSWFTRGWTLQELLAPRHIEFYSKEWTLLSASDSNILPITDPKFNFTLTSEFQVLLIKNHLATFTGGNLCVPFEIPMELRYQIYKATSITRSELLASRFEGRKVLPICRIMQLAAYRNVSREEDRVYSLMGLLQVGIPIAYGEGEQSAFARLIREISTTKFCFADILNHGNTRTVIPNSVTDFITRSPIFDGTAQGRRTKLYTAHIEPVILTHIGIRLPLLLVPIFSKKRYKYEVPSSSEIQTVTVTNWKIDQLEDYLLLDTSESSARWINSLDHVESKHIIYLGVINFFKSLDTYQAGSNWLCIPMAFDFLEVVNIVCDIDPNGFQLRRVGSPVVIQRSSDTYIRLPLAKIRHLGMHVTTVHVR